MTARLLLLGTEGCHLCEEAWAIIADCLAESPRKIEIASIDIAEQDEWQADYALKIPVLLETESRRELCWPFDQNQAAAFLQQMYDSP